MATKREPQLSSFAAESQDERLCALLQRVSKRDREAFAELYDCTSEKIYGLAVRVLRSPSLAEEAAQETYLHVWENAATYSNSRGRPLTWMLTICHRRSVDRVRSEESRRRREDHYSSRAAASSHPDAAEIVIDLEAAEGVRTLLGRLPRKQSEAVALVYIGGLTPTEAATHLSVPVPTAKSRLRDGLKNLRKELEKP